MRTRTLQSLAVGLLLLGCSPTVEPVSCTDGGAPDAGADLAPTLAPSCPGNPELSCSQKPGELPGQRCSVSACYCATGTAACCCASAPDLAP